MVNFNVLVIDDTLGELQFARHLLEELEQVAEVVVADFPDEIGAEGFSPDILIVGPRWLNWARRLREKFPGCYIIGRCPWQGDKVKEFFPWGNRLREPSVPLTHLIPA